MKNKLCWHEENQGIWAWDTLGHLIAYFALGVVSIHYLKMYWWFALLFLNLLGIWFEYFEMTWTWDAICKSRIGQFLHLGGKASCISIKDLICNLSGSFTGVVVAIIIL